MDKTLWELRARQGILLLLNLPLWLIFLVYRVAGWAIEKYDNEVVRWTDDVERYNNK